MTRDKKVWRVIERYQGLPFRFGEDCCQFTGDVIEAITGSNPMDRFKYDTESEANSILSTFGGLRPAMTDVLGEPDGSMETGDAALVDLSGPPAAGVVYKQRLIVRTPKGLTDYPFSRAICSWSVK